MLCKYVLEYALYPDPVLARTDGIFLLLFTDDIVLGEPPKPIRTKPEAECSDFLKVTTLEEDGTEPEVVVFYCDTMYPQGELLRTGSQQLTSTMSHGEISVR